MVDLVYHCVLLLLLGNDSESSQPRMHKLAVMGHRDTLGREAGRGGDGMGEWGKGRGGHHEG